MLVSCGKDNFEKVLLELGREKSIELGMSIGSSKTRIILISISGCH